MVKKGLGKGLGALLAIYDDKEENNSLTVGDKRDSSQNIAGITEIALSLIDTNPNQPRKTFDKESLNELADSIKIHGVIQPIILNKIDNRYTIIAGERRFRASKIAGLKQIPAIVKNYTEKQIKEISLIENLQREDLNPIEAGRAIKELMNIYNLTQEAIAERIGKSRPAITNLIRLLSLEPEVIKLVEEEKLSAGHARCLIVITNKELQIKLANMASNNKMSVRDLEKAVKEVLNPKQTKKTQEEQSLELKNLISNMQKTFATKVYALGNDRKGRIYIDYYSRDDLDRIHSIIEEIGKKA